MNALAEIKISGQLVEAVVNDPASYPEELWGPAYEALKDMAAQLYDAKKKLEQHIILHMQKENATKLVFRDGTEDRVMTLKNGTMQASKDADVRYQAAGFEPLEIGEYVFKPSWSKAKEARKIGGTKQLIIDELFTQGNPSLDIK